MTNVICGQQKAARTICVVASQDVHTCNAAKQQSYEKLATAITQIFHLHIKRLPLREVIFQADYFV